MGIAYKESGLFHRWCRTPDINEEAQLLSLWTVLEVQSEKIGWSRFVFCQTTFLWLISINFWGNFDLCFKTAVSFPMLTLLSLSHVKIFFLLFKKIFFNSRNLLFLLKSSFNTWNVEEQIPLENGIPGKEKEKGEMENIYALDTLGEINLLDKHVFNTYCVLGIHY